MKCPLKVFVQLLEGILKLTVIPIIHKRKHERLVSKQKLKVGNLTEGKSFNPILLRVNPEKGKNPENEEKGVEPA